MVNTVTHLSTPNATDTYDVENGLPRPNTIKFGAGVVCPDIPASPITAADATCPSSAGNSASVTPRTGITHEWSISAGSTITSATTGDSITFTAAQSGTITLTVTARDACNSVLSTKTIALFSAPTPPAINAPASVCGNSAGHTASVPTTGATHTWSIAGGTITSPTTGDSITFTAGASGTVTLTATALRCGSSAQSTRHVLITSVPTAAVTGATIVRGDPVSLRVDLTGAPPWTVQWRDMASPVTVSSTPSWREITPSPNTTTTYWVDTVTTAGCSATVNASGTVHVLPPPPALVIATTRENLTVDLSWSAVVGASGYQVERTTLRDGVASWSTIVSAASTAYVDTLPPSTLPVTYIYYVRTIDGETSNRGAFDFATGATTVYEHPVIVAGATVIKAGDLVELRRGIDAFRAAFGLGAAFGSASPPSGMIRASDFTALVTALNEARFTAGYSNFGYTVAPQVGSPVLRLHVTELRETLR